MNTAKRAHLEAQGWQVGTVADFLALSPEEMALLEMKVARGMTVTIQRGYAPGVMKVARGMTVTIQRGYAPGVLGRITELHARYYHRAWGFGLFFEAKVAAGLAHFLHHYDPERDGLWTAVLDTQTIGSVAIDRQSAADAAHLRWFILAPEAQGRGVGTQLLNQALAFVDAARVPLVYLNTFAGLDGARRLYERSGFVLARQQEDTTWGVAVQEQRFERRIGT